MKKNFYHHLYKSISKGKYVFLTLIIMNASLCVHSQNQIIKLSGSQTTVGSVIKAIQKQTGLSVDYSQNTLNTSERVTIDSKAVKLSSLLNEILSPQGLDYEIQDRHVIVTEAKVGNSNTPQPKYTGKKKITGHIVDSQGEPIIGASIIEKGTSNGAVSDLDGNFSIEVKDNSKIAISYIGYSTKEYNVSGISKLSVLMHENDKSLEEVVVVGYGVQKKRLITGATVSLKGEDLQKLNTTNALQAMQGQTAGVNITSVSGQPGGSIKVNIRGAGTIGNSSPTYVVDGVITSDITYLNNADIAYIDVLKDAASCAIYGVNGANGVVLITTRSGSPGTGGTSKGQISFDSYYGIQNAAHKVHMLNAQEYATMANEAAVNSGKYPYFSQSQIASMGSGTNWMNEMFSKNVPTQNYNIAANGGNSASIYSVAFSYTQQGGIIGGTDLSNYERSNFRVNTEHSLYGNFIKLGEHLTYSHVNQKGIQDGGIYGNSLRSALSTSPLLPMYDENGKYVNSSNYTIPYYSDGTLVNQAWNNTESNPYAMMQYNNQNENKSDKLLGDVYVDIQPFKNLKIKSAFGLEYNGSNYHSYKPTYALSAYDTNTSEAITQNSSSNYTWNWDNTINYLFKIKKHSFDVLLGSSIRKYQGSYLNGSNQGSTLFGDLTHGYLSNSTITSIASSTDKQIVSNSISLGGNANSVVAHESFFGRINYNYDETYMASLVFRADGSTNFAKGNQWGYFPSVSVGWVMSNEKWMASTKDWMDFLKLRANWGTNGNDNIATTFAYESLITLSNATYNIGGTDVPGSYPSTLGTSNLKWETSQQLDLGFDARFLNSKLNANFDWYKKTTKNWLVQAPVYGITGVATNPYINGGNVSNTGVEIQLSYNDNIGKDFKYTITGTYSYNKNNVTKIPTSDGIIHGGTNILFVNAPEFYRAESGHAIGYFWGYKTAGIFQNETQIQNYVNSQGAELQSSAKPGDVILVDTNHDGKIDVNDKTDIGDPNPHHLFGVTLSCAYKKFDFSVAGSGVAGNKIAQGYRNSSSRFGNWTSAIFERWHGEGTSNTMPRVTEDNSNWTDFSDLYLKDGDYFRISNVTLGYDFTKLINCKYVSQCRLYVSVENLYTFTKYDGMDPEVGYTPQSGVYKFGQGVDVGFYPRPRIYMIGLNVKF